MVLVKKCMFASGGAVLLSLLSGCGYLGTAQTWDPQSADKDFELLSGLVPLRQHQPEGCGSAALTMVLRFYGEAFSVEEVSENLLPHDPEGVTARALRDFARKCGYKAHLIEGGIGDLEEQIRKGRPLIVGLIKPYLTGGQPHYEVVAGMQGTQRALATLDPARGWTLNSYEGFLKEWAPSGNLLLIIAPPDGRREDDDR